MLTLLRRGWQWFATSPRRQNFFELNPIYPDAGQKDFDIYNVNYTHIPSSSLAVKDEERYMQLKQKLTNDIYLKTVRDWNKLKTDEQKIDQQTGFPIGIHQDFDAFIEIFKREQKVGSNVLGEFSDLVMTLMRKFQAKSEIELIKIFRINLANIKKNSLKDKLRGLLINTAFLKFIQEKKFKTGEELTLAHLQPFLQETPSKTKKQPSTDVVSQEQLEQIAFREALKELDSKIQSIQDHLHKQALANGSFVPNYHPNYGPAIVEQQDSNLDYDIKFPRGFSRKIVTNEPSYTSAQQQDRFIQSRINKLFFMQALKQVQAKKEVSAKDIASLYDLPIHIRKNDKLINQLLYRYKEYDLLVEPDLNDIYQEVDIALKKITVKVVPDYIRNQQQNAEGSASSAAQVPQRILSKQALLWQRLDVQEIFDAQEYDQQSVDKVKIDQKQIAELSPSATLQLSLNKMPMNLYRHADLEQFAVFNKYRKFIYKDCITDRTIDPQVEFKFFSLEQAQSTLKKIKRVANVTDKFYGHATRKSGEAEVYITRGNGKVIVNGQPLADYFGDVYYRGQALKPLVFTQTAGQFDCEFTVVGGGLHGQSQCMAMALTHALIMFNPKYEDILSQFGLTGIDDRKNESKKMGLYTARVRPPYVRR